MSTLAYNTTSNENATLKLMTMRIGKQLLGIPVSAVRDVLHEQKTTKIPLVSKEISGVLNLRGHIVTVLDIHEFFHVPVADDKKDDMMFVVIEHQEEFYGLVVDSVGDVLDIYEKKIEASPPNLDEVWKKVVTGVYPLEAELLVIVDPKLLLTF